MHQVILQEAGPDSRPGRSRLCLAAFLVALSMALLASGSVRPLGGKDPMNLKLRHFAEHRDEYDLVFIGSSRIYRGFAPSVMEERLREEGVPLRAYNFGLLGLSMPGAELILRRIGELEPERLRWVLVDPESLEYAQKTRNPRARRVIEWHDAATTWALCQMILSNEELSSAERWELVGQHCLSFVYHATRLGQLSPWIADQLGLGASTEQVDEFLGERDDGYRAYHGILEPQNERERKERERDTLHWDRRVRGLSNKQIDREPLGEAELEFYRRLRAASEAAGAQLVLVTAPSFNARHDTVRGAYQLGIPILRYDRPQKSPGLYLREHRFRHEHLNDEGARAFTEALTAEFVELMRSKAADRRKP